MCMHVPCTCVLMQCVGVLNVVCVFALSRPAHGEACGCDSCLAGDHTVHVASEDSDGEL